MNFEQPAPQPRQWTYWQASRTPVYGLIAILPLFLIYEGLLLLTGSQIKISSDVWLVSLIPFLGEANLWVVKALAVAALGLLFIWQKARPPIKGVYFGGILVESLIYSMVLGSAINLIMNSLPFLFAAQPGNTLNNLMLSAGAGLYEELLFRVLIFGGLTALLNMWKKQPVANMIIAAIISSLWFSAIHHMGAFGDPWDLRVFSFRTIAGLIFAGLYISRGFGIAALTHALYDVWILVFQWRGL